MPPQNIDAERAVLGAMMLVGENKVSIPQALKMLQPDSFYHQKYRDIFTAIVNLFEAGKAVDLLTVTVALESMGKIEAVGGVPFIDELIDSTPTAANIEYYAELVANEAVRRSMIQISASISKRAYDGTEDVEALLSDAQSAFLDVSHSNEDGVVGIKDAVKKMLHRLEAVYNTEEHILGLATGFADLDVMTSGLEPGDYIILAGRPSMGKSALVQNIMERVCFHDKVPTYLSSLEMAPEAVVMRFVASVSGVNMQSMRTGNLYEGDWEKLTLGASIVSGAPMLIDGTAKMTPTQLRSKVLLAHSALDIGLIVVDYLQLMVPKRHKGTENEEVQEISRSLKALAREIDCPLIAVSQLNRQAEQRPDNRPKLSDLRSSGAIEQDGDHVWLLYRPGYYKKDDPDTAAELIVAKQRQGPTGTIELNFDKEKVRFTDRQGG